MYFITSVLLGEQCGGQRVVRDRPGWWFPAAVRTALRAFYEDEF